MKPKTFLFEIYDGDTKDQRLLYSEKIPYPEIQHNSAGGDQITYRTWLCQWACIVFGIDKLTPNTHLYIDGYYTEHADLEYIEQLKSSHVRTLVDTDGTQHVEWKPFNVSVMLDDEQFRKFANNLSNKYRIVLLKHYTKSERNIIINLLESHMPDLTLKTHIQFKEEVSVLEEPESSIANTKLISPLLSIFVAFSAYEAGLFEEQITVKNHKSVLNQLSLAIELIGLFKDLEIHLTIPDGFIELYEKLKSKFTLKLV